LRGVGGIQRINIDILVVFLRGVGGIQRINIDILVVFLRGVGGPLKRESPYIMQFFHCRRNDLKRRLNIKIIL
jgi:hypothetical protein